MEAEVSRKGEAGRKEFGTEAKMREFYLATTNNPPEGLNLALGEHKLLCWDSQSE